MGEMTDAEKLERKRQKQREATARWRERNPERAKSTPRSELSPETLAKEREADLLRHRKYKSNETSEQTERRQRRYREYYYANRGRILARNREWRLDNPEEAARKSRENARIQRKRDPEGTRAASKKWKREHPERVRERSKAAQRERAALKKGAKNSEKIYLRVLAERDAWICHLCGEGVTRHNWSHDHLVPLSKKGDHTYANVKLAHYLCNCARQNRPLPETGLFFLERVREGIPTISWLTQR